MILMTTENLVGLKGYEIKEYKGFISEATAFGVNDFIESFLLADKHGGESFIYNETFKRAKASLMEKVETEAETLGANAVLALRINYSEISGKGKSMLLISATGTAVSVEMTEELKKEIELKNEAEKKENIRRKLEKEVAEKRNKEIAEETLNKGIGIFLNKSFEQLYIDFKKESNEKEKKKILKALMTKEEYASKENTYAGIDWGQLSYLKGNGDMYAEIEIYKRENKI